MTFWTYFWLFVPPILLVLIGIVFYIVTGKKKGKVKP